MIVVDDKAPVKCVDLLTTHTEFTTSVREVLLYLEHANAVPPQSRAIANKIKQISDFKVKVEKYISIVI